MEVAECTCFLSRWNNEVKEDQELVFACVNFEMPLDYLSEDVKCLFWLFGIGAELRGLLHS